MRSAFRLRVRWDQVARPETCQPHRAAERLRKVKATWAPMLTQPEGLRAAPAVLAVARVAEEGSAELAAGLVAALVEVSQGVAARTDGLARLVDFEATASATGARQIRFTACCR